MNDLSDVYVLRNGIGVPCIGFGTFELPPGSATVSAVLQALSLGYRHIDTATAYRNEADVGRAMRESGLPREHIFLTTKLANADGGYDAAMRAFERSLKALNTDYIDLYLMHRPEKQLSDRDEWRRASNDAWRALEHLYNDGSVHAVGVANFMPHHLDALECSIAPMVNQTEYRPGRMQEETVRYCSDHDILVETYGPFAYESYANNATLQDVSGLYGKSVAQIVVRWCLQHNVLPVVRTVDAEQMTDDASVFDFAISQNDLQRIDAIKKVLGADAGRAGS